MSDDSEARTLGDYRKLYMIIAGGEDNPAVKFLDAKIAQQGSDAEVLADETQMLMLLNTLLNQEQE